MIKKSRFVDQIREGDRVDDLFLVKSAKIGETKAGKPYLILTVMDKSGELTGPIWDNAEKFLDICRPGEFIQLQALVQSYKEKPQLKIDGLAAVAKDEVDLADFLPTTLRNREEMAAEMQDLIRTITNPHLKKLLNHFFKKDEIWQRFQDAPAAKGIHHAYIGGLLEHCLSMAKIADMLAAHYEGVDRSLLIAGALLHDIGKVEELGMANGLVDYTDQGRLKGHLVIGSELIGRVAARQTDFPDGLLAQLQHLILSHHGRQEFGSPVVPMTVEAFLLSSIDDIDAKMNLIEQLRRKMNSDAMSWSEYQRSLERFLFLNRLQEEEGAARLDEAPLHGKQQKLF
jgi:3'-5' exoribonuclease